MVLTRHRCQEPRTVTYSSNHNGTFLVVESPEVPGPLTIRCDGDAANAIARCVVTGSLD